MTGRVLMALLVVAVIASAIGVVVARHHHRQAFVELTRLQREADELDVEFGRLQLEQAAWAETNRIEQVARQRLGMGFPAEPDVRVVRP